MKPITDTAGRDEYCHGCGYPFDSYQRIVITEDDTPYCSRHCAQQHHRVGTRHKLTNYGQRTRRPAAVTK